MPRKDSAIQKRKDAAEELVKKHFGKNYSKLDSLKPEAQLDNRAKALVAQSLKAAELNASDEDKLAFKREIINRAEAAAKRAMEDYLYSLTRRSKLPIYGASAFNEWKSKQLRKLEKEQSDG